MELKEKNEWLTEMEQVTEKEKRQTRKMNDWLTEVELSRKKNKDETEKRRDRKMVKIIEVKIIKDKMINDN